MKKTLVIVCLLFAGCAELTTFKIDNDGYYRFKHQPIEVKAPDPSCTVFDTEMSVDFSIGAGYWQIIGGYAVQVFPNSPKVPTEEAFLTYVKSGSVARFIENDRKPAGFNFKVLKTEQTTVNGRPAWRGIGIDRDAKIPALFLVTVVYLDTRTVFASLVFPLERLSDSSKYAELNDWTTYNQWVATIREIKK